MLVLSCIFYILWQRQFHLQAQTMTRSQEEAAALLPFVLLGNPCQHQETAGAAPALLHGHPHSGVLHSLKTSCFPQQAMKWDHLMTQATSDKLDSTQGYANGEASTSLLWFSINILPFFSQLFRYASVHGLASSETFAVQDLPNLETVRMSAQLFGGWHALSWMKIIL